MTTTPWLSSLSPFSRLLFFILLMIACFGVIFLAGMLLAGPLFRVSVAEIPSLMADYGDPGTVSLLKYFQILQTLGLFILPPLLAGYLFGKDPAGYLALNRSPRQKTYWLVLLLLLVMTPMVNGMIAWNERMDLPGVFSGIEQWMQTTEESATRLTEAFMSDTSAGGILLNLLMIAALPAVGEEFVFRGVIQRLLGEWTRNIHVAILLSALAFSAMHLQFYGLLPRFFLGVVFGYLFYWTGSLWIPVFAHFMNNVAAVVFETLSGRGDITGDPGSFGAGNTVAILASAALTGILLLALSKRRNENRSA